MTNPVPYGLAESSGRLDYMAVEVSWGSRWENINDHVRFRIGAEGTRDNVQKTYKKITTESPILGGNYLVHAVPDMVNETLAVWIYGDDQTELAENYALLETLFEQWDFRIRWTLNESRETWRCQLPDANGSRNQVWTHNLMARMSFTIPRYPEITRETIN